MNYYGVSFNFFGSSARCRGYSLFHFRGNQQLGPTKTCRIAQDISRSIDSQGVGLQIYGIWSVLVPKRGIFVVYSQPSRRCIHFCKNRLQRTRSRHCGHFGTITSKIGQLLVYETFQANFVTHGRSYKDHRGS